MNPEYAEKLQKTLLDALAEASELVEVIAIKWSNHANRTEALRVDLYLANEIAANLATAYATVCGETYRANYWFSRAENYRQTCDYHANWWEKTAENAAVGGNL